MVAGSMVGDVDEAGAATGCLTHTCSSTRGGWRFPASCQLLYPLGPGGSPYMPTTALGTQRGAQPPEIRQCVMSEANCGLSCGPGLSLPSGGRGKGEGLGAGVSAQGREGRSGAAEAATSSQSWGQGGAYAYGVSLQGSPRAARVAQNLSRLPPTPGREERKTLGHPLPQAWHGDGRGAWREELWADLGEGHQLHPHLPRPSFPHRAPEQVRFSPS